MVLMHQTDSINIEGQNLYGLIYNYILRVEESKPDYEALESAEILSLFDQVVQKTMYSGMKLKFLLKKLRNNFPSTKSKRSKYNFFELEELNSAGLEKMVWEQYCIGDLPLIKQYEEQNKQWFLKKNTSSPKLIQSCMDSFEETTKGQCSNYLKNREMTPVVSGNLYTYKTSKRGFFPSWLPQKHRKIAIAGRVKSFASAVEKVIRRTSEYQILSKYGGKEEPFEYCVRHDLIAARVFYPVPEMIQEKKKFVQEALNDYKTHDNGLKWEMDVDTKYNSIYYDVFSNYPLIHNRDDAEVQLTSIIDFLQYEYCSEDSRGLFDQFRPMRLREKVTIDLCGYIDDQMDTGRTQKNIIEALNKEYVAAYISYSNRFFSFYNRAREFLKDDEPLPPFMEDAVRIIHNNIKRIKSCVSLDNN